MMLRSLVAISGAGRMPRGAFRKNRFRQGRGKLTSKEGTRLFYKGKGVRSRGRLTSKGAFHLQPHKQPEYEVPDLTGFQLKPYVSRKTPLIVVPPPQLPSEAEAYMHYSKLLQNQDQPVLNEN